MNTAVVIPVHNALPHVQILLGQIAGWQPEVPLLIVDDCSAPETAEWLERHVLSVVEQGRDVILLRNERQQLFTRTSNRGMRAAYSLWNPEAIALVNTDCILKFGWLEAMQKPMQKDPALGILGYPDGDSGEDWQKKPISYVQFPQYITGHCLLLRTQMLKEVGVFCETDTDGRFDPDLRNVWGQAHIGSERILNWRANEAGWKSAYVNAPLVDHGAGESWGRNISWLSSFNLEPLWAPNDTLTIPENWV